MTEPVFRPGRPGLIPDAWVINGGGPAQVAPIVAVHGIRRAVRQMAHLLAPRARETGRTVILPHFDKEQWRNYQRAACARRSDKALLALTQALVEDGTITAGPFDIAGFSGGAQFAHRFTWMYPHAVGRLCVTSPGWWTFSDVNAAWPYGMGLAGARRNAEAFWLQTNLKRFLDRDIVVCVGSDDIKRDANLRSGPEIDAQQGPNRLVRAQNWVRALRAVASDLGVEAGISFNLLKGVGHSFSTCVERAHLDRLFVTPPNLCASCQVRQTCAKSQTTEIYERNAA